MALAMRIMAVGVAAASRADDGPFVRPLAKTHSRPGAMDVVPGCDETTGGPIVDMRAARLPRRGQETRAVAKATRSGAKGTVSVPLWAQALAGVKRFVATELIVWLNDHKIVRPGYTTLQEVIGQALSAERQRLGHLLAHALDDSAKAALAHLIARDDTLSELAVLRQDARDFRWRQMARERQKRALLDPLYSIAKALLPTLGLSQQNLLY